MLKVHTSDGLTIKVDLSDRVQAKIWLEKLKNPAYQASLSGLTITCKGAQYSLPRPRGFNNIFFHAESIEPDEEHRVKGGERIMCVFDDVRLAMMVHNSQPAARVSIFKTGKQRFNPLIG